MKRTTLYLVVNTFIALVWLVNGLWCKVFQMVPRHEQIVARILGAQFSKPITLIIGTFEILLGTWILWKKQPHITALVQIGLIVIMNILEVFFAPDLLLWGGFNLAFALLFCLLIYWNASEMPRR